MAFKNVGPLTYLAPGAAAIWNYSYATDMGPQFACADIKSYGHATWGASEVWDSYWMPVYSKAGVMTAKKTNLAYSVDLVRGIDVYRVDLPGTSWDTNPASITPVGSGWVTGGSAIGVLLALLVAVVLRRRTTTRSAVSLA